MHAGGPPTAANAPIFKVDGVPPDRDGLVGSDEVYGSNSSYMTGSQYSMTLRLTTGMHRMYHGVVLNTP